MNLLQRVTGISLSVMVLLTMTVSSAWAGAARHAAVLPGICEQGFGGNASTVLLDNGRVRLRSNSPAFPFDATAGVVLRLTDPAGFPVNVPVPQGIFSFRSNNNTPFPETQTVFNIIGYYEGGTVIFVDVFNDPLEGTFAVNTAGTGLGALIAVGVLYTAETNGRITLRDFRLNGKPIGISVASPQDCQFLGPPFLLGAPVGAAGKSSAKRSW